LSTFDGGGSTHAPPDAIPRWRLIAGIAGPAAFVAAWSVLGAVKPGYSPVQDPISQLAAVGASTRVPMTLGFLAFGAGVGAFANALRTALPGGAGTAAAVTADATVGVAALPLGASFGDWPHGLAAGIGYLSLAATPLLGGLTLRRRRNGLAAVASFGAAGLTSAALVGTTIWSDHTGLLQRAGLSVGDAWLVAVAAWMLATRGGRNEGQSATSDPTRPSKARSVS
jgi:hypothetical protein